MTTKRLLGIASASLSMTCKAVGLGVVLAALSSTAWAGLSGVPVPEIDAGSLLTALTLLSGGILVLTNRSRRQ
jgi:hypothetical protein